MAKSSIQQRVNEYLLNADKYKLGILPTEQPHPRTKKLSTLANDNLLEAIRILKSIDLEAIDKLIEQVDRLEKLKSDIQICLNDGGRIFICGCGATGRLALNLEYLALQNHKEWENKIVSFMAGGDVALVHSLEGFEDFPDYGARHLSDLQFSEKDLLISVTEGGETPFVIGATQEALRKSKVSPYFLYCNPDEVLVKNVQRSKDIILNKDIKKINLSVGPMALSGSTRMQASTVLMAGVGSALFSECIQTDLRRWKESYQACSLESLKNFIELESDIYIQSEEVLYCVRDLGLPVFTDTTERSPTFNLKAFENKSCSEHSLCYIYFDHISTAVKSWEKLLGRSPRPLNWPEVTPQATPEYLNSFCFDRTTLERRNDQTRQWVFRIERSNTGFRFVLKSERNNFNFENQGELFLHLNLKMILNIHSTLVMGRMSRYQGNLMTWVNPTNGKLIDRAVRYIRILLADQKKDIELKKVVLALFECIENNKSEKSIVDQVVARF